MTKEVSITVPWPPSANVYWRTTQYGRLFPSKKAKEYIKLVESVVQSLGLQPMPEGVELEALYQVVYPADKRSRRRDLGNCEKVLSDALESAGVIPDDVQLHRIVLERMEPEGCGCVKVVIKEMHRKRGQELRGEDEEGGDMDWDVFGI